MRGDYCGFTRINGSTRNVYVDGQHFGIDNGAGKFERHVKASTLRKTGIYVQKADKSVRKVYGKNGFIGSPKR